MGKVYYNAQVFYIYCKELTVMMIITQKKSKNTDIQIVLTQFQNTTYKDGKSSWINFSSISGNMQINSL